MIFPSGPWPLFAFGLVALTWVCRWIANGRLTMATGLEIPVVIIILMALVGYSVSIDKSLSYTRFWSLVLGILTFFGIANALRPKHLWAATSILALLAIGIVGFAIIGTDWQQTRLVDIPWIYDHLPGLVRNLPGSGVPKTSELINPRLIGITLGIFVSFFLAFLLFSHNRNLRLLSLVIVIVGFITVVLTQTLAGIAGVLVALLLFLAWKNRWFLLTIPLGLGGVVAGVYIIGPMRVSQYLLSTDNPLGIAMALRLDMWSRAVAMIKDMPFTGIGLNTFTLVQPYFYPGYILGPEPHAHNLFLQTALDLGLPGLIAFLCLIMAWIYIVHRKYLASENYEYRIFLLGLVAGVLAYLSHGFMDAMMLGSKPGLFFWIFLGMGIAALDPRGSEKRLDTKYLTSRIKYLIGLPSIAIPLILVVIHPTSVYMNIGAIQAHKALSTALSTGSADIDTLEEAKAILQRVYAADQSNLSANDLLGRIYAWEQNPILAIEGYAGRVAIDGNKPLLHYYPAGYWLEKLEGKEDSTQNDWQDLVTIYSQWSGRYPDRAELYTQIGLVWQCHLADKTRAASVIESGIQAQAKPIELLKYYQNLLFQGDSAYCEN